MTHAAMLLALILPTAISGQAGLCPTSAARIEVSRAIAPPRFDLSRTEGEMRALAPGGQAGDPDRFIRLAGLTVASIAVDTEIGIAASDSAGAVCARPETVKITLSTAPVIFLARGLSGCQLNAAREHELRHTAIDRDIIERYSDIFRARIDAAIGTLDQGEPRQAVESRIDAAIAAATGALDAERAAAQRALDSPEEYDRLSRACPPAGGG